MAKIIELRPCKELLNIHFEKYQFSSQVVPITDEINLSKNLVHREPLPGQDSLLEARLFAFHNHLFQNPYDYSCWFFDENDNLFCLKQDGIVHNVYSLPRSNIPKCYNSTIAFASSKISVLSNGGNTLHILIENTEQKIIRIENIECGVLMDARHIESNNSIIIVMSSIVEENSKKRSKISVLNCSLTNQENPETLKWSRRQELIVNGPVDYIYIESTGNFIDVLSRDSAIFTHDSVKLIGEDTSDKSELKIPKYYWSQDADSLTVWLKIPEKHRNAKAHVKVTATSLAIIVEDTVLVQGDCQFCINAETAKWSRDKDTLKLKLMKQEDGQIWNELIMDDTGGEHLPNEELSAEIHSRLSNLCTDQPETENGQPAIGFNAEQLEECDLEGDQNYLQRINLQDHSTTHLAILGTNNRVLFTQNLQSIQRICIRQDHDGCVWSLIEDAEWNVRHTSTFPGFGYVEASKSNKKFCISPPNGLYVVIVEHTRHAFIYEKPGKNVKVAKQKIVDLGTESLAIMGAIATNDHLILLTKNKLYKLKIN